MNGDSVPDGSRMSTCTVSLVDPGLKTSICEEAPVASCAWGIDQCDCGAPTPGTSDSPPDPAGPTISWISEATTCPVRAVTIVLKSETCCTSTDTFSAATWPGARTMP